MECKNCGFEVPSGSKFCPHCGVPLRAVKGTSGSLKYEIKYRPSYSLLEVEIPVGSHITAEAGSMTYMSGNIKVETRTRMKKSGIWGTIKVSLLGGETLFVNDYIAQETTGKVGFVSAPLGDITCLEVKPDKGFIVQSAGYIASTEGVTLDTKWQGFTKGLFGQNLFMIKTIGEGDVFINTFGAIDKHELKPREILIVDNYHLAALSDTCNYEVRMFGGLKSTILGGEGLITEVEGPGEVYIQTKNIQEFVNWLWRYIRPKVQAASRHKNIFKKL
ncbi:TIGR00266 family protein [Candidatus Bathyarchaeota archaeon]|nr:TIGR00266 family protein [Candidatus Bathyarchaeota archaeon]